MVEYNWDLALVKYYKENLNDYLTYLPMKVVNTLNQTLYVKETITSQGNNNWTFDDGSTVRTFSVNANSYANRQEGIKAGNALSETTKDQITVVVEYFTDEAMQNKFGQDVINATIHAYIQQSDGTWGSSTYAEDDVVYDYFDFSGVSQTTIGTYTLQGKNGNAKLYIVHTGNDGTELEATTGLVSDVGLFVDTYVRGCSSHKSYTTMYFQNVADNSLITDKFIAGVVNVTGAGGDSKNLWLGYVAHLGETPSDRSFYSTSSTGIAKFMFYPLEPLSPSIESYTYRDCGNADFKYILDGIVIFKKLT